MSRRVILTALIGLIAAIPLSAQQRREWSREPAMTTARSGVAAASLSGRIYVVGGRDQAGNALDVLERYDPQSRSWNTLPPMPTPRFDAAAIAFRGRVVVVGGRGFEQGLPPGQQKRLIYDIVEAYDPQRERWERLPSLAIAREGPAAFVLDDTLFVAGGSDVHERIIGDVEYLSQLDVEWKESQQMRLDMPRAAFAVVVAQGKPFAIGGFTPVPVSTVQDLRSGRGVPRPPTFQARGAHAAVAIGDSIFIMGGRGSAPAPPSNPRGVLASVDLYVPPLERWEEIQPMTQERESFAAVAIEGRVFALGGRDEDGVVLNSVEMLEARSAVAVSRPELPPDFFMEPASPNPFSSLTNLAFSISDQAVGAAQLVIFDVMGRRVRTLLQTAPVPGYHTTQWDGTADDGTRVAAGMYLCVLTHGVHRVHEKVILVR